MTPRARLAAIGLLLAGVVGGGSAQTVYRCGPDGRSYSQQPCAEGRALAVDDVRGADARREGEAAAARQARAAALLAQERQRRDAERPRAASLGRSASGDPSFAPTAPLTSSASSKAASRKASKRKGQRGGDSRGKAGATSAASADAAP